MRGQFIADVDLGWVKERLTYDPRTGVFTNRIHRNANATVGKISGHVLATGYRIINLQNRNYQASRLAWFYVHGQWPIQFLDHINGNRDDNRIDNLREVTTKQNAENQKLHRRNKSGHRGVHWSTNDRKWMGMVTHHGEYHYVGLFTDLSAAVAAVRAMRDVLYTHHKTEHAAP